MCFTRRLFLILNAGIIKESAIFITAEISHSILKKKKIKGKDGGSQSQRLFSDSLYCFCNYPVP